VIAASTTPSASHPRLGSALLRAAPDGRLAQLAGEGSDAAFEELVRRYRSGLVAFAARIASRDSADDVVQDSVVKAHAALCRGDRPDSVRAWLFAIARNTALNDRRDRRVHQQLDESHDGVEQPPETIDRRSRLRDMVEALRSLPAAQREAIVQRELAGKGHDEIARELRVSPGAVRQLIFRARATLRAGAGALLPMQLVRAVALSGAGDQAGSGAATGAGMAAKLGLGTLLTTGALVAGTGAVRHSVHHPAVAAQKAIAKPADSRSDRRRAERIAHTRSSAQTPQVGRQRTVVVVPRQSSSQAQSPSAKAAPREPKTSHPGGGANGAPPSPGGGGGAAPGGPGSAGSGGDHSGGAQLAQASSAPSTGDCPPDGGRDPGPTQVSPG
jgi:RNA polymerase sigma factor (sigma-70 family)